MLQFRDEMLRQKSKWDMNWLSKDEHKSAYKRGDYAFIWFSGYIPGTRWVDAGDKDKKAKSYSQRIQNKGTQNMSGA